MVNPGITTKASGNKRGRVAESKVESTLDDAKADAKASKFTELEDQGKIPKQNESLESKEFNVMTTNKEKPTVELIGSTFGDLKLKYC
jgi:hypothetical protein